MSDDLWYFAYGSNLSIERKKKRTGDIRESRRARLKGYRLAFDKDDGKGGAYANIVVQAGAEVWGVIYRCDEAAMAELDRREGVALGHYHRKPVTVVIDDGNEVEAVTYVAGEDYLVDDMRPSKDYLEYILTGAREHGLPEDYVKAIETLAGRWERDA